MLGKLVGKVVGQVIALPITIVGETVEAIESATDEFEKVADKAFNKIEGDRD